MFILPSIQSISIAVTSFILLTSIFLWHMPSKRHLLGLSPALALGVSTLLFYVIIPVAVLPFLYKFTVFSFYHTRALAFDGSVGQVMIFFFGCYFLILHLYAARFCGSRQVVAELSVARLFIISATISLILAGILTCIGLAQRFGYIQKTGSILLWISSTLTFTSALVLLTAASMWRLFSAIMICVATIISLYLTVSGKQVAFTVIILTLLLITLRQINTLLLICLLIIGALIASFGLTRSLHRHGSNPIAELELIFEHKVWARQVDTGLCLSNLIEIRWKNHKNMPPLYFLSSFVPRSIWADKPVFSLGSQHALEYCDPTASPHHSASVTMLGEPLENAGLPGIFTMILLLSAVMVTILRWGIGGTAVSVAFSVALYPWLIDFDQDFAMYLGNAVKFTLPLWPLAWILNRVSSSPGDPKPSFPENPSVL